MYGKLVDLLITEVYGIDIWNSTEESNDTMGL